METSNSYVLSGKVVVMISPEDWGENLLSKHHLALALARRDNAVWFICAARANGNERIEAILPNLTIVRYSPLRGINRLPTALARLAARLEVREIMKVIPQKVDIVWSFDPYQLQFLRLFKARLTIYHPVDNHYTPLEGRVVREADVVFSNSEATLSRLDHPRKHRVGHGVADYFFGEKESLAIPGDYPVKVGYIGNLNNRLFAIDVYRQLVKANPGVGFYMVGPRGASNLSPGNQDFFNWSSIDSFENVHWLGPLSSPQIPSFLKQMDILLVLYNPDASGFTVNPHKILEYLSSGKVIICPFHEENRTIEHLILQSRTLSDLPELFGRVVQELAKHMSPEVNAARIACATGMTYESRLDQIERILNDT